MPIDSNQLRTHGARTVLLMGNSLSNHGTIWCADVLTGERLDLPWDELTPHKELEHFDGVRACLDWAKSGNADAMWWLGWHHEGIHHSKSVWYYIAAIRRDPKCHGWAIDRVRADAIDGCSYSHGSHPCIKFLNEISEFAGRHSKDWKEAISKAELALHKAVESGQLKLAVEQLKSSGGYNIYETGVTRSCLFSSPEYAAYELWRSSHDAIDANKSAAEGKTITHRSPSFEDSIPF